MSGLRPPSILGKSAHISFHDIAPRSETGSMSRLPRDAKPYRRTDTFTSATIPAGLLRSHATKAGVWGLIHVLQGHLVYRLTDPAAAPH